MSNNHQVNNNHSYNQFPHIAHSSPFGLVYNNPNALYSSQFPFRFPYQPPHLNVAHPFNYCARPMYGFLRPMNSFAHVPFNNSMTPINNSQNYCSSFKPYCQQSNGKETIRNILNKPQYLPFIKNSSPKPCFSTGTKFISEYLRPDTTFRPIEPHLGAAEVNNSNTEGTVNFINFKGKKIATLKVNSTELIVLNHAAATLYPRNSLNITMKKLFKRVERYGIKVILCLPKQMELLKKLSLILPATRKCALISIDDFKTLYFWDNKHYGSIFNTDSSANDPAPTNNLIRMNQTIERRSQHFGPSFVPYNLISGQNETVQDLFNKPQLILPIKQSTPDHNYSSPNETKNNSNHLIQNPATIVSEEHTIPKVEPTDAASQITNNDLSESYEEFSFLNQLPTCFENVFEVRFIILNDLKFATLKINSKEMIVLNHSASVLFPQFSINYTMKKLFKIVKRSGINIILCNLKQMDWLKRLSLILPRTRKCALIEIQDFEKVYNLIKQKNYLYRSDSLEKKETTSNINQ